MVFTPWYSSWVQPLPIRAHDRTSSALPKPPIGFGIQDRVPISRNPTHFFRKYLQGLITNAALWRWNTDGRHSLSSRARYVPREDKACPQITSIQGDMGETLQDICKCYGRLGRQSRLPATYRICVSGSKGHITNAMGPNPDSGM